MRELAAVQLAIAITNTPHLVRSVRKAALPQGMTFLLEVAAGDTGALQEASRLTGHQEQAVCEAAGFFIEQVLLTRHGDSYRTLGALTKAPADQLRRHMALLLKWLHPDVAAKNEANGHIDRSIFAKLITLAWEDLKTKERRADYDRSMAKNIIRSKSQQHDRNGEVPFQTLQNSRFKKQLPTARTMKRRRKHAGLVIYRLERENVLTRLALFLRGRR